MCAVQVCDTSKVYYTSNLTGPKAHNIIYFNRVHSLSNHYIRSSLWKSQLWFFSTFGVQFETHYESGIVFHRFIPIGKILKSVLNEHVTPFTCYWSLALVVHGKEECIAWQTWNYLNNWWMKSQRHEFFFLFISGMGPVASRWVIIGFFSFLSRAIFLIPLFMCNLLNSTFHVKNFIFWKLCYQIILLKSQHFKFIHLFIHFIYFIHLFLFIYLFICLFITLFIPIF